MAHYAKVNNGLVEQVIVAESEFFNNFVDVSPGEWIQTSYNTHGGVHNKGGTPLRKNFAGIGFTYDSVRDAFYAPQPYPSWTLNNTTFLWEPPVEYPNDDIPPTVYNWNETTKAWDEIT